MLNKDWQEFTDDASEWDELCEKFNGNYRQLYNWGEYQTQNGWKVLRYVFYSENEIKYAAQILYKKKYFFSALYIPGGVLGELSGFCPTIKDLVRKLFPKNLYYLRIDSSYDYSESHHNLFLDSDFTIPLFQINAKDRFIINFKDLTDGPLQNSSSRFRRDIRNSYANIDHIDIGFSFTDTEIEETSGAMQRFKKITLKDDPKHIVQIINFLKKRIIVVVARDENNKMLGFRCAIVLNGIAYDKYAANTESGRKVRAGYALLDSIIMECERLGLKSYLLPTSSQNEGDKEFKRRTGGKLSQYMDGYETTNFPFIITIINLALYFQHKFD